MITRHNRFIIFLALAILSIAPVSSRAESSVSDKIRFKPEITIPGLLEGEWEIDGTTIAQYIRVMFIVFVWAVGIVATVMVIYGGIKWVAAAGNPGRINDARDIINSAIIGVIIALSSIVLLSIINPGLTSFKGIVLKNVDPKKFEYAEGDPNYTQVTGCPGQADIMSLYGGTQSEVQAQLVEVKYVNNVTNTTHKYQVHRLSAAAFQAVFEDIKNNPYDISKETSGGTFLWRQSRNNSCLSLHSFGIAIDVNPSKNPNCVKGTSCFYNPITDIPPQIISAFKAHGFVWGGNWRSVKDYMHFEWHG